MERILSETDIDAIAQRVVQIIGMRLGSLGAKPDAQPAPPPVLVAPKLAYTIDELMSELGVSRTTVWRWEVLGLLHSRPHLRHKIYSPDVVEKFLKGQAKTSFNLHHKRRGRAGIAHVDCHNCRTGGNQPVA